MGFPFPLREETLMKWCARCDSSRWVCERHPDRPFSGSRACTCGGAGIPCPVCNPADEYNEPAPPEDFQIDAKRKDWDQY
jgi:hypothetical protein